MTDHTGNVTALTRSFEDAVSYAIHIHAGQTRKGTVIPYIAHPLSVAALVLEHGGDETEAIAALLHDAVEDCGGLPRLYDIRARFGLRVARIVEACSDSFTEEASKKPPWNERKQRYLAHLRATADELRAGTLDADQRSILLVSLADKLHNARSILADYRTHGDTLWSRFNAARDEQLWYYRELLGVFSDGIGSGPMVEELRRIVAALETETVSDGKAGPS